jgi:hypothetical protein
MTSTFTGAVIPTAWYPLSIRLRGGMGMGMGIRVADIRCPAVMVPTPIYVMASVIQMVLCPHDFRAAAKVITTTHGATK